MRRIYILCFISLFMCLGNSLFACSSDFSCSYGESCVKEPYKSRGVCMKTVDKYGIRTFDAPRSSSVGPRMNNDGCNFSTDCPIGFKCQRSTKVCVKR